MTASSGRVERVGDRLVIVGTVHVDPQSVLQARERIRSIRPSVVALELDDARLYALAQEQESGETGVVPSRGGVRWSGLMVLLMAVLERFAGRLTGSMPGREMLGAVEEAKNIGAGIVLVDLPFDRTVRMLRTSLPFGEKLRLGVDSVASLFVLGIGSLWGGKEDGGLGDVIDNGGVDGSLAGNIGVFRKRYPVLSRLLIDNREEYMAGRLKEVLDGSSGTVVAIVGLGHVRGLVERLRDYPGTRESGGFRTSFSWTVG